jgi:uncharacterized protein YcbK (DUF882 family)
MISVNEYLMNRDKEFPLDMLQARNMAELLSRVNYLFGKLDLHAIVSSGYRPASINKKIGGAKMSTHTVCAGIDLSDPDGRLANAMKNNQQLLKELGLCLENPEHTKGWIHLDIKKRTSTIFNP